jgi:hypothetical protein
MGVTTITPHTTIKIRIIACSTRLKLHHLVFKVMEAKLDMEEPLLKKDSQVICHDKIEIFNVTVVI